MTDTQPTPEHDVSDFLFYALVELKALSASVGGYFMDTIDALAHMIDAVGNSQRGDELVIDLPESFDERASAWFMSEQYQEYLARQADLLDESDGAA